MVEILETDFAVIPGHVSNGARECLDFENAVTFPTMRLAYRSVELGRHEPFTHEQVDTSSGISEWVVCALLGSHLDALLKDGLNVFAICNRKGTVYVVEMFQFNGTWHMYLSPPEMEWNVPIRVFKRI